MMTTIAHPRRQLEGWQLWLEVAGGVSFAMFFFELFRSKGAGWLHLNGSSPSDQVSVEIVFLIPAIIAGLVLTHGIRPDITLRSTLEGLKLDWPELVHSLWTLAGVHAIIGHFIIGPSTLWLALAVGTVEELFFRVVLLGWLVTRVSAPAALVISSITFGVAHSTFLTYGTWSSLSASTLTNVVPQIAGGFVLGAIYLRTRNPLAVILAHAAWDFPLFMLEQAAFGGGSTGIPQITVAQMLPWLGYMVYGLWLIRDGVSLTGVTDTAARQLSATR